MSFNLDMVDEWHDRGPWKVDKKSQDFYWSIVNSETGTRRKIGVVGSHRANHPDQAKRLAAERNKAIYEESKDGEQDVQLPMADDSYLFGRYLADGSVSSADFLGAGPTPLTEAMARHGSHAQELANKNDQTYAIVAADHNGRKVVHLRLPEDVGKNEKIIAVFHPDQVSDELPNIHPDDFERWMKIANLTWHLARRYGIPLKKAEPRPMPFPNRVAVVTYREEQRMVISIRYRDRKADGGKWHTSVVPWPVLVEGIVQGLTAIWSDNNGRFSAIANQRQEMTRIANEYINKGAVA